MNGLAPLTSDPTILALVSQAARVALLEAAMGFAGDLERMDKIELLGVNSSRYVYVGDVEEWLKARAAALPR